MSGRMGTAIEQTIRTYPGLLENDENLLFKLKCRQFIEMVNGCDFDVSYSSNLLYTIYNRNAELKVNYKTCERSLYMENWITDRH